MIPHKHIAQDFDTKPLGKEAQKIQKFLVVCIILENGLPLIAS